jgi:hypothetical protein
MIAKWYAVLSVVPVALLVLSPVVLPQGSDPRGYGPVLVGALVAFALSGLLFIIGIILVAIYRKAPRHAVVRNRCSLAVCSNCPSAREQNPGATMTPNHSLNRTRVRRASCGARRHAPVSLVR